MELQQLLERLSVEVAELSVPSSVPIEIPPIQDQRFYRKYICSNTPCLLEGMTKGWHAIGKWDRDYLSAKCQDKMITVDITPNGRGDAVVFDNLMQKELFVTPYSEKMTLCQFFQMRERTQILKESIVPYVQHQNGNLLSEFPMLTDDVPKSLEFADRLFDQKPDAVNLWIGDQRSATSFHKDHYENFYAVLRGTKLFTVLPPCSVWRMHLNTYDSAQYHMENNQLCIKMNEPNIGVRWCPIDLEQRNDKSYQQQYKHFFNAALPQALQIEVKEGQILYLPSMWYHYVEQIPNFKDDIVIAINYWYDMKFDSKYAYFKMIESLAIEQGLIS